MAARRSLEMQRTQIIHGDLAGYDLYLSRTGYTGEPMAFEIFVQPDDLVGFWRALLEAGKPFGLRPCGLAARDSLRIEAGLPLYGHELAGPLEPEPVGRRLRALCQAVQALLYRQGRVRGPRGEPGARLVRFQLDEEHAPLLDQGDVIVNRKGRVVGWVTSCSINTEGRLVGLGFVQEPNHERDTRLGVYRVGRRPGKPTRRRA